MLYWAKFEPDSGSVALRTSSACLTTTRYHSSGFELYRSSSCTDLAPSPEQRGLPLLMFSKLRLLWLNLLSCQPLAKWKAIHKHEVQWFKKQFYTFSLMLIDNHLIANNVFRTERNYYAFRKLQPFLGLPGKITRADETEMSVTYLVIFDSNLHLWISFAGRPLKRVEILLAFIYCLKRRTYVFGA